MSQTYDYIITLKKSSPVAINIICQLLLLMANVTFIYTMVGAGAVYYPLLIVVLLSVGWWVFVLSKGTHRYFFRFALMVAGIGWMLFPLHKYLFGIVYIIIGLLEKQTKFPSEIGVDKEGILINSFPKKQFAWSDVRNALIKDNILTIDFKSNKLLQKEIQDFVSKEMQEEFNVFCRGKITAP